jgi:2-keto-3-deoxy-L-rhamnonate aldolase RhmA
MTRGRHLESTQPPIVAALEKVLMNSLKHEKFAGIFAGNADLARQYARRGFKFVSLGTDLGYLRRAAENALARAKGEQPPTDKPPF